MGFVLGCLTDAFASLSHIGDGNISALLDAMEDNLPDTVSWNDPDGGMFVWLRTPEGTDAMRLYERLLEGKLVVMPGRPFHVRGGANTIRLNFATPTDEQIAAGMKVLGDACRELYG